MGNKTFKRNQGFFIKESRSDGTNLIAIILGFVFFLN
jgi:hypothetical protein